MATVLLPAGSRWRGSRYPCWCLATLCADRGASDNRGGWALAARRVHLAALAALTGCSSA